MRMGGKEERGKVGWNVGGWDGWMDGGIEYAHLFLIL
jgi:hypothetical protein